MDIPKEYTECAFNLRKSDNVCSNKDGIEIMKQVLNNMNKHIENKSDEDIVKILDKELECDEVESCIYNNSEFVKIAGEKKVDEIKNKIFKPEGPWNNKKWLSNLNIDNVFDQWKDIYPGVVNIPFQMRDFEKQKTLLSTIDLAKEYKKGMKSFVVVLNTDFTSGGGEHWFCIFGDFNANPITLEYFNSSGNVPMEELHDWLHKTKAYLEKKLSKKVKIIIVSRNELQKSNSECGPFSIFYVYSRLNDVPYSYFSKAGSVSDEQMYEFRKYLYRKSP